MIMLSLTLFVGILLENLVQPFAALNRCSGTGCQPLPTSEERRQSIRNNTSALFLDEKWGKL